MNRNAPVAQLDRALPSEGKGHTFESCRVRHFGTKLGTPKPAVFALAAATSVRSSTLFDPMMRTSFASTSTRGCRVVKEQTTVLHAQHLAERGFITLAVGSIDSGQAAGRDRIPMKKV
jgi:hypothetical protein